MGATQYYWYITCSACSYVESFDTKKERDAKYTQHVAAHDAQTYAIEN